MGRTGKWTNEELAEMRWMKKCGLRARDAAEKFGVQVYTIYAVCSRHGIYWGRMGRPVNAARYKGNPLYEARVRAGLSREAAAERIGCTKRTVQMWEMGLVKRPHRYCLEQAAKAYGAQAELLQAEYEAWIQGKEAEGHEPMG